MVKKETISDSISYLSEKKVFKVKQVPSFPLFTDKEEAKKTFIEVIGLVDLTIEELVWIPEYDKVIEWMVMPKRKGLLLAGDSGRLKSTITRLVLPVLYCSAFGFIIRPVDSCKIDENWGIFNNSPIINIDDIGAEPPVNDFGIKREPINTLIDFCEKNSKLLIATSNLKSKKIQDRYGIRTLDRLDLLCKTIWFEGDSMRK